MTEDSEDTKDEIKKGLVIFGRDVSQIPCFRNSILYGITGGLSLGLLNFLFTSKSLKSVNFSVYSFSFIAMAYWIQCRFNYSKTKFEMLQMQEQLSKHAILEGSQDPSLLKKMDEVVEV